MSKPIEVGCRVVVIDAEKQHKIYIGTETTCIRRIDGIDAWETDIIHSDGLSMKFYSECLKRIDDYDGNQAGSWEALEGIYKPKEKVNG